MKKNYSCSKIAYAFFLVAAIIFPFSFAEAASMAASDYINRNIENLTSGVTHEIVFTSATNVSGGAGANSLILIFPDGDDGLWCRTAGSMTLTTSSLHDSATSLPGTLSASCAQGSGASSYDTITITGVNDLTASTAYGVRVAGNAGALGTPANTTTGIITVKTNNGSADVDSRNIAVDIITNDQVAVTGRIDPTISFAISDNQIGFGTITSAALRYATGDEVGSASVPGATLPTQINASTNAQSGIVIEIRDTNAAAGSGMYNSSPATTLTSRASTAVSAGTVGFGVYAKNASSLTIDEGFDHDSSSDLAISTSFQTLATSSGAIDAATVDLVAIAAVAGNTPPGDYADTMTLVATGKF